MPKPTKILLVDDNSDFSSNVQDILELKGYDVETVEDGFTALQKLTVQKFDLVLMDIKMPVMNGVETFIKMKAIAPRIPVIMVTAFAVDDLIREALVEGAFTCLRKPVDFEVLFEQIDHAIGNGHMILVVDDNQDLCDNLRDILCRRGYRVSVATDGETAVDIARQTKIDILILDMKLPPVNGLETYMEIRKFQPSTIVIIVSGFMAEMEDMIHETLIQGACICMEKPIQIDRLISLINELKKTENQNRTSPS